MPKWNKSLKSEHLKCKFATLMVDTVRKQSENHPQLFNLYIFTGTDENVQCLYKKEDAFIGNDDIEQAKRILIRHYKWILQNEIDFITDQDKSGVF